MFKRKLGLAVVVLAGVCAVGGWAMSDDKKAPDAAAGGMDAKMMEAWQKYMTPGEHHAALLAMAGKFNYECKYKMDPSQSEWMSDKGTYEGKMIMDGRFLQCDMIGTMMGQPWLGHGMLGYDNSLNKHVAIFMDSCGTGIMRSEGTCGSSCKEMTFAGEMMDCMTNKMTKYKYSYDVKSNDQFVFHFWTPNPANGEMWENMTITYNRAK